MLSDDRVTSSKRAFPRWIIRAEKRHAGGPEMGGQMRQGSIRRDEQRVLRQHWNDRGERRRMKKYRSITELLHERLAQSATTVHANHRDPVVTSAQMVRDFQPSL